MVTHGTGGGGGCQGASELCVQPHVRPQPQLDLGKHDKLSAVPKTGSHPQAQPPGRISPPLSPQIPRASSVHGGCAVTSKQAAPGGKSPVKWQPQLGYDLGPGSPSEAVITATELLCQNSLFVYTCFLTTPCDSPVRLESPGIVCAFPPKTAEAAHERGYGHRLCANSTCVSSSEYSPTLVMYRGSQNRKV